MRNFKKGTEPNLLEILVDEVELKPFAKMNSGIIEDGIIIKTFKYDLDSVLVQMLEEYGEEELINRIKKLE